MTMSMILRRIFLSETSKWIPFFFVIVGLASVNIVTSIDFYIFIKIKALSIYVLHFANRTDLLFSAYFL